MYVYKLTNKINGKAYIGMASGKPRLRFRDHRAYAKRGSKFPLHTAIRKYGWDAFAVEIICCARNAADLAASERAIIEQEGTYGPGGYNATRGGQGTFGRIVSPERRAMLSEKMKGQFATGNIKPRAPGTFRHSEETKAKFKLRPHGPISPEGRIKISNTHRGDKNIMRRSREAVLASAERRRGAKRTPEQCARISAAMMGRPGNKGPAKLTIEQVSFIKALLKIRRKQVAIAALYRVKQVTICNIKTGKHWPEVPVFATI